MLSDELRRFRIILASGSPRRYQLLKEAGLHFEVIVKQVDESFPSGLDGAETAMFVARQKASVFLQDLKPDEILITADTIVWCDSKALGKPVGVSEALEILNQISGNTHEVITAVVMMHDGVEYAFYESTKVTFDELSEEEIRYYATNFHPYDKAGGYGIQDWIGIIGCSRLEGSYFNVVGLPVHRVYQELKKIVNMKKDQVHN